MAKVYRLTCAAMLVALLLPAHQLSAQSDSLLVNPGFEAPFVNEGGNPPRQVANGWDAWNLQRSDDEPDFQNTQPEYSETVRSDRILAGSNAQRFESFFATHTGGVFQVVPGVGVGNEVTFSVNVWVWSSGLTNEDVSENDGDVLIDVGIDPTGGTSATSGDILWSVAEENYDSYEEYSVSAIAEADAISVWVRSRVGFPVQTSRIYLDDASLEVDGDVSSGGTNPTSTLTSTPSATPTATATSVFVAQNPSPTFEVINPITPAPTNTPQPTATLVTPIGASFPDTITYTVQRGDTLSGLATRFGSSVAAIQQANGLGGSSLIFVEQNLVIPVAEGIGAATATSRPTQQVIVITATPNGGTGGTGGPIATASYVVQPGDTLSSIARRTSTTVQALAQLNGIVNPNRILAGQTLLVAGGTGGLATATPIPVVTVPVITAIPSSPSVIVTAIPGASPQTNPGTYVVQPGENLFRISLRFNVSLSELIRANGITNANRIFAGQQIIIP